MIEPRLATHIRVAALRRAAEAAGSFATVLRKGDPDAGSLLVIRREKGANPALFEPAPSLSMSAAWQQVNAKDIDLERFISEYCERRIMQDRDIWIVELDVPFAQRFTDILGTLS